MNYISKAFQIQYLSYYKLYILSGHQEELLMVMDDADSIQALLCYPSEAPSAEATKLLALPFREVTVVLPQHNVSFIPKEIYREEEKTLYTEYLINRNDGEMQSVDLEDFQVTALFQYDSLLWKRWYSLYPEARFVPTFVPLFSKAGDTKRSSGHELLIHIEGGQVHFLLTAYEAFKFYNVFHASTWEDIAYYTLKLAENFGLEKIGKILLSGITPTSEYAERLKSFADEVTVWQHGFQENDVQLEHVSHLNLIHNCRLCVS